MMLSKLIEMCKKGWSIEFSGGDWDSWFRVMGNSPDGQAFDFSAEKLSDAFGQLVRHYEQYRGF